MRFPGSWPLLLSVVFSVLPWPPLVAQSRAAERSNLLIEPVQERNEASRRVANGLVVAAAIETGYVVVAGASGADKNVGDDIATRSICFAVGPVRDRARAVDISRRYTARQVKTRLKTSLDKHYLGIMVYVDGHASRAEARKTASMLAAQGIRDHIIINPEGRLHLLSLGVFAEARNAERLRARIERLGYSAKHERRFRERTVYFVFGEQTGGGGLPELLDENDLADGIVRIPTPCSPD